MDNGWSILMQIIHSPALQISFKSTAEILQVTSLQPMTFTFHYPIQESGSNLGGFGGLDVRNLTLLI